MNARQTAAAYLRVTGALLLLVTGCSSGQDVLADEDVNATKPARDAAPLLLGSLERDAHAKALAAVAGQKQLSELRTRAARAMEKVLFDPGSAQLRDLRAGRGGAICGKVNAKNRYGAYVGFKDFVVGKDGWPEISEHNNGVGSELFTSFAAAYLAGCATKEE